MMMRCGVFSMNLTVTLITFISVSLILFALHCPTSSRFLAFKGTLELSILLLLGI